MNIKISYKFYVADRLRCIINNLEDELSRQSFEWRQNVANYKSIDSFFFPFSSLFHFFYRIFFHFFDIRERQPRLSIIYSSNLFLDPFSSFLGIFPVNDSMLNGGIIITRIRSNCSLLSSNRIGHT